MTSAGVPARGNRWFRAFGYGLLAEVATIITIIVIMVLYRYVFARGLTPLDYDAFAARVGAVVGIVGGTLYTFFFAQRFLRFMRLMRHDSTRFIAHGIVVALGAIALSVGGSLAGHHGLPSGYLIASALKIIAGALAGFLAMKKDLPVTT
ncbi:MAG TPA: hypothetical protein VK481_08780 [Gemmatimonadaceae bacterium]|nr:hypothetical protein [Gemmatimonadaceae bacterium]